MKIQFLGTGAGVPSKHRNTQSIVLNFMDEIKECFMIDCGEGTQHKMMYTNLKPAKITKIFISHLHGDHILGLIGFLSSRNFLLNKEKKDIYIFGPKGIKEYVTFNLKISSTVLNYNIHYKEFSKSNEILYDDKNINIESFKLIHGIESYAFKLNFKDKKGTLNVEKLKEIGIKPGKICREIKEKDFFEFNGKKYISSKFLGEDKKGKKIVIISDTLYFSKLKDFIKGIDVLVSECTYLYPDEKILAKNHMHMNIEDINNLTQGEKIDKIYLTHISSRYDKKEIKDIKKSLKNNINLVNDMEEYEL